MNRGFTLVELVVAITLASIIFAGVGSLMASAFRHELLSVRQQALQGAATIASKRIQKDLSEATFIKSPALGAQGDTLEILLGCVYDPAGWKTVGSTTGRRVFRRCLNGSEYELQYFAYSGGSCGSYSSAIPPSCGGAAIKLVSLPVRFNYQAGRTYVFSRVDTLSNAYVDNFDKVDVFFQVVFPALTATPQITLEVETRLTAGTTGLQP